VILPADQARRIERGERTTVRVPVDPRLLCTPLKPTRRNESKPFRPKVGDTVLIAHPVDRVNEATGKHVRGWETVCHTQVVRITRGPLGTLTDEQANAEGYETAGEFVQAWVRRHDGPWLDAQVARLIEGGVPEEEALETMDEWAKVRYRDRWQTRETWTLTLTVDHDVTRFLAPAARPKGSEHGYVLGVDEIDAGIAQPIDQLANAWPRRAVRRHLDAISENASPEERARRARALARRVRELALQDPKLTRRIEELVRAAEKDAA
jgi:hypothetical protein